MGEKRITQIDINDMQEALALAWEVFTKEFAPSCTLEGADEFWDSIDHDFMLSRMGDGVIKMWAAFDGDDMVGMVAMRNVSNIQLIFVDEEHRHEGVGTNLLKHAILDFKTLGEDLSRITVEAMGESYGFFRRLGFTAIDDGYSDNGIFRRQMFLQPSE